MTEGSYEHESGWTFTAHRTTTATETYAVTWRSPEGKRGIIRPRMTVGEIEMFDPDQDWARGVAEFQARRSA